MDIYKWSEEYNADYYDYHSGYIYKCQEYREELENGNVNARIRVTDLDGNTIGYARKDKYDWLC